MVAPEHLVALAALLFALGTAGALVRRNGVRVLLSLQVMLAAASLALVAFSRQQGDPAGHVLTLLLVGVGVAQGVAGASLFISWSRDRPEADGDESSSSEC